MVHTIDCQSNSLLPLNEAGFGKVMGSLFPGVLSRRFGVRGAMAYHYVGIHYTIHQQQFFNDHSGRLRVK
jgi:hypothetical protein